MRLRIPESEALKVANRIYDTEAKTLEEISAIATRPQMREFRLHLEACHDCGPKGLCEIGARLRVKGKADE